MKSYTIVRNSTIRNRVSFAC